MENNPSLVNLHIRASNEETLERLQYANNLANLRTFNYQTPYESKTGDMVVWFYADITRYVRVTEDVFTSTDSEYSKMDVETLIKANAKLGSD